MPSFKDVLKFGISDEQKTSATEKTPLGNQFMVSFLVGGIAPNPVDTKFQKISGISTNIETQEIREGGENIYMQSVPTRVVHQNLVLERGIVIGSLLNWEFNAAMTSLRFAPSNVLVILLDENSNPLASWSFYRAYPVKWSISDLDANKKKVVIETMELAYARFQSVRI